MQFHWSNNDELSVGTSVEWLDSATEGNKPLQGNILGTFYLFLPHSHSAISLANRLQICELVACKHWSLSKDENPQNHQGLKGILPRAVSIKLTFIIQITRWVTLTLLTWRNNPKRGFQTKWLIMSVAQPFNTGTSIWMCKTYNGERTEQAMKMAENIRK